MTRSRSSTARVVLLALIGVCLLGGCRKALFTERDVRSQYDRYDLVRGNYEPPVLYDEFGDEIPNIKGRLSPK